MSQAPKLKRRRLPDIYSYPHPMTKQLVIDTIRRWNKGVEGWDTEDDDELRQVIEWIESHDRRVQLQLAAVRELLRIYEETKQA
jgi:hypothetical protein